MKFLSVCSGIESASVAWNPLGWKAAGFSEIDPFASEILRIRFPGVTNFGDLEKFKEWRDRVSTIDLLVGGTPCQSFSIAGLRKGLRCARGELSRVFCEVARDLRSRWLVWENVPGVLSVNGGRDFGTFLRALSVCGYGFAYRVLDARFARSADFPRGLPQRRRRVFVVGYRGDWRRPAAVLFDRESLRGDPTEGRGKRGRASSLVGDGTPEDRGRVIRTLASGQGNAETLVEASPCLNLNHDGGPIAFAEDGAAAVCGEFGVRRLMPVECERLQGFPDGWTAIPWKGKPASRCADMLRYQVLGNAMPVNCVQAIGERIALVDGIE